MDSNSAHLALLHCCSASTRSSIKKRDDTLPWASNLDFSVPMLERERERESRSTNSAAARYCYCYALSITPCKRKRTYSRWRSCFTLFRFWYLQWFFKPRRNFWNKRVSVCVWGGVDNSDPVISKMGALISLFFLM